MPVSFLCNSSCSKVLEFPIISMKNFWLPSYHFQIPEYLFTLAGLVIHLTQKGTVFLSPSREVIVCCINFFFCIAQIYCCL